MFLSLPLWGEWGGMEGGKWEKGEGGNGGLHPTVCDEVGVGLKRGDSHGGGGQCGTV